MTRSGPPGRYLGNETPTTGDATMIRSITAITILSPLMILACDPGDGAGASPAAIARPGAILGAAPTKPGEATRPPAAHSLADTSHPQRSNECDVWAQDCAPSEKCVAYAEGGGSSWNAVKCVPIAANPGQTGDACTVEGGGTSGIDTCDRGNMCWEVNAENVGTCVAQCAGSPDAPSCVDGGSCLIANDGVLALCFPACDPLVGDCPEGDTCLPSPSGSGAFMCVIDASGEQGKTFDACEFANACDPGRLCLATDLAAQCDPGASGCCLHLVDTTSGACSDVLPWFEEGLAPPGLEHLGVCLVPACGDGNLDPGEACDDGNYRNDDYCSTACLVLAVCGDGVVGGAEQCDDGDLDNDDGCSNNCRTPGCGNGALDGAEACDDGNTSNLDACTNTCHAAACGDGFRQLGEQCDDGNLVNSDTCLNTCKLPSCGDGVQQAGEQCDDGKDGDQDDGCTDHCAAPACGDGFTQASLGETCDDANASNTDACTQLCRLAACGDGYTQAGEACDDGNKSNTDACVNTCVAAACGDGFVGPGEQCDDGNQDNLHCTAACHLPSCGDGVLSAGEQCDDGNHSNEDSCAADCTPTESGGWVYLSLGQASCTLQRFNIASDAWGAPQTPPGACPGGIHALTNDGVRVTFYHGDKLNSYDTATSTWHTSFNSITDHAPGEDDILAWIGDGYSRIDWVAPNQPYTHKALVYINWQHQVNAMIEGYFGTPGAPTYGGINSATWDPTRDWLIMKGGNHHVILNTADNTLLGVRPDSYGNLGVAWNGHLYVQSWQTTRDIHRLELDASGYVVHDDLLHAGLKADAASSWGVDPFTGIIYIAGTFDDTSPAKTGLRSFNATTHVLSPVRAYPGGLADITRPNLTVMRPH